MQPTDAPSVPELVAIWEQALRSPLDLCADLTDEQWHASSLCPGWDVADVVAHMADIDAILAGRPRPEQVPDWDRLPHVVSDVGRFTEMGVDAARGTPRPEVLGLLREVADVRRTQLDALDADAEVLGPFGRPTTLERLLRVRVFDLWVHGQDLRAGLRRDGGWAGDAAVVTYQQLTRALPNVWATAGAPAGAVVRVVVTGPDVAGEAWAVGTDDGRGAAGEPVPTADVELEVSWPDYALLSSGRIVPAAARTPLVVRGDGALAEQLVANLAITP